MVAVCAAALPDLTVSEGALYHGRMDELTAITITLTDDELILIDQLGFDTPGDFVRQALDHVLQLLED